MKIVLWKDELYPDFQPIELDSKNYNSFVGAPPDVHDVPDEIVTTYREAREAYINAAHALAEACDNEDVGFLS